MNAYFRFLFLVAAFAVASPIAWCQTDNPGTTTEGKIEQDDSGKPQQDGKEEVEVLEFEEQYNRRFLPKEPKLGATIEGLSAFDEQGETFDLDQLRGRYTVVVFGCLT